ncbi:MAG: hypothetical protein Q9187_003239 [Circinaria calcarea]
MTTVVAYPTPFCDYKNSYYWSGVLPSTSNGHTICVTANTQSSYTLGSNHPPLPTEALQYPDGDDNAGNYGHEYSLLAFRIDYMNGRFIASAFSGQLAGLVYETCQGPSSLVSPVGLNIPVSYLTETSTSYEAGGPVPKSVPSRTSIGATIGSASSRTISAPSVSTRPQDTSQITSARIQTSNTAATALNPSDVPLIRSTQAITVGSTVSPVSVKLNNPASTSNAATLPNNAPESSSYGGNVLGSDSSMLVTSSGLILVLGTSTQPSDTFGTPVSRLPAFTFGGSTYTPNTDLAYMIGAQTLTPGGVVTVSNTPVSLPISAAYVLEGTSTIPLGIASKTSGPKVVTFASQTYTENSASAYLIDGQTLTPGGMITLSGTTLSLPTSAAYILQSTSTIPLLITTEAPGPEVITFAGQTYRGNSTSAFLISSQTLTRGDIITLSGTTISLPTSGAYILEGSSTIPFLTATETPEPKVLTFAGKTYTMNSESAFVIGGQTLQPGTAITVSGTPMPLAASPTDISTSTSAPGLASLIMDGFGRGASTSTDAGTSAVANSTISPFQGAAGRVKGDVWIGMVLGLLVAGFLTLMG